MEKKYAAICANLGLRSLRELADKLGVSVDTVRSWEIGRSKPTTINQMKLDILISEHAQRKGSK